MQAVAWRRQSALQQLARRLLSLSPTKGVLRASGLGWLIRDKQIWAELDNSSRVLVSRAEQKWRAFIRTREGRHCPEGVRPVAPAFAGKRPTDFLQIVDGLSSWLIDVDEQGVHERVARK